jgi:hypothetical protein
MANVSTYDEDARNKALMKNIGNLAGTIFEMGTMFAMPALGAGAVGTTMATMGARALAGGLGAQSYLDPNLSAWMAHQSGKMGGIPGLLNEGKNQRMEKAGQAAGQAGAAALKPKPPAGPGDQSALGMYPRILSGRLAPIGGQYG